MKRKNKVLPLVLMGLITLSGCSSNSGPVNPDINNKDDNKDDTEHEHYFSYSWTSDENNHWHQAICGHDLKVDVAPHEFENGICKVCGYEVADVNKEELKKYDYRIDDNGDIVFLGFKDNSITDFVIPDIFTVIGGSAFLRKTITSLSIPSTITKIEGSAFFNAIIECDIIIPDSVVSLGEDCFFNATFSNEIVLPDSIVSIGESCFNGAILSSIQLPNGLKEIPDYCFYCSTIKSIVLPDSIERIGKYAFGNSWRADHPNDYELESITLSKNLKYIEDYAFLNCYYLTEINIFDGLETIGRYAFECMKNVKEILLPDTVTSIAEGAFNKCYNLSHIKLSSRLKRIVAKTFYNCYSLEEIDFPEGIEVIEKDVFEVFPNIKKTILPSTIKEIGSYMGTEVYYNGTLEDLLKIDGNPFKVASIKCMKDKNGEYIDYAKVVDIVVPDCISELSSDFLDTFRIKKDSYSTTYDFHHVNSITIPKSVVKIVDNCLPSDNIYYEGTFEEWIKIEKPESCLYYGNYADINLHVKENGKDYVESNTLSLPENLKEIKPYEFYAYRINNNLVISSSVEHIGKCAFYYAQNIDYLRITNPLVKIDEKAFGYQSNKIKTIEIDNPNGEMIDIAQNAFEYSYYTVNIIYNGTKESFNANTKLFKALTYGGAKTIYVTFPDGEKIKLNY